LHENQKSEVGGGSGMLGVMWNDHITEILDGTSLAVNTDHWTADSSLLLFCKTDNSKHISQLSLTYITWRLIFDIQLQPIRHNMFSYLTHLQNNIQILEHFHVKTFTL